MALYTNYHKEIGPEFKITATNSHKWKNRCYFENDYANVVYCNMSKSRSTFRIEREVSTDAFGNTTIQKQVKTETVRYDIIVNSSLIDFFTTLPFHEVIEVEHIKAKLKLRLYNVQVSDNIPDTYKGVITLTAELAPIIYLDCADEDITECTP